VFKKTICYITTDQNKIMKRYTYAGFIIPLIFSTILLITAFILLFRFFGSVYSGHPKKLALTETEKKV